MFGETKEARAQASLYLDAMTPVVKTFPAVAEGAEHGLDARWCRAVGDAAELLRTVTTELGMRGAGGDIEGMMRHSTDYLLFVSGLVVSWLWLRQGTIAKAALSRNCDASARDF